MKVEGGLRRWREVCEGGFVKVEGGSFVKVEGSSCVR